jgi:hypothetical protein
MSKTGLCTVWVLLLAALRLPAQVTVEVVFDEGQDQFLRGEAIKAGVRITNLSGRTLHFGADDDWLTFTVQSREGGVVARLTDVPVRGEFDVESASRATRKVDLRPYFNLNQTGGYAVVANVRIKAWDQARKSEPKSFYVMEGAKLWEQDFGVFKAAAGAGATNSAPEVRKYSLQQVNHLKDRLRLYLRISDQTGARIFNTVPIGQILSFSHPEPQIDKFSNLHLIYQSWAHVFSYSVFTPDGELLKRETYDYVDTRPRLQVDGDGFVGVIGGVKREKPAAENAESGIAKERRDLQAHQP